MVTSYYALSSALLVFVLTAVGVRILLPRLQRLHAGQTILEIGPSWHKSKEGTPTMGGLAPIAATLLGGSVLCIYAHAQGLEGEALGFLLALLYALGNGLVGMVDDATKLAKKRNLGLTPPQKLLLQSTLALAYLALLRIWGLSGTAYRIPFTDLHLELGWAWYPLSLLFLLWFVNCANLTDGIDGLATSVASVLGLFFAVLGSVASALSISLVGGVLLGAGLGFLLYNRHPAKIFMGDTGSLFFGGLAIGGAFLWGSPLLLLLPGAVYLAEGLSVVLQVGYFKLSHGKRLFRMAPLHHHLEKCGWSEKRITLVFSLVTLLGGALALWSAL